MNQKSRSHRADLKSIAQRAMLERDFLPEFSSEVMRQVSRIQGPAVESDPAIRDLRGLLWVSIDNDDSRDLDQLSVAQPLADGLVQIMVAVADVDALVPKDSPVDRHAEHNTTSIYTAAEIFPMLPERLSTDLTSLVEGEDRMAVVVEMVIDPNGGLVKSSLARGMVHNHAKLAYNGVSAWLEGTGEGPAKLAAVPALDEQLRIQDQVAQRLKRRRHQNGALSLETIEPRPIFFQDLLADLEIDPKNRAKELIEDFMIAANGVIAGYLQSKGIPSLRRILRAPDRWQRIVEFAAEMGGQLPAEPDAVALEAFLVKQKHTNPVSFPDVSLCIVKLMGSGEYVLDLPNGESPGHFGLAIKAYTHSTAPNRRFPDLITQRQVKALLKGTALPYNLRELGHLAQRCTEREDEAEKVERQVRKSAAALLLESRVGERFDAIVTGASSKSTWVRIVHPAAEGKLVSGADGLDVADKVAVKLAGVNVERGYIDFVRVGR
jgi:exoribonuclease-2